MRLYCYGTGSKGNHYILEADNGEKLAIELGIKYNEIMTHFDLDKTVGILLSHHHKDHDYGKNVEKLKILGLPMLMPETVKLNEKYDLGSFQVIPIEAIHNVECISFLIKSGDKIILFATDTNFIPKIRGVKIDTMICEINHIQHRSVELLSGDEREELYHLCMSYNNHMGLETMCKYLNNLDYKVKKFLVIHYSTTPAFDREETIAELNELCESVEIVEKGKDYEI